MYAISVDAEHADQARGLLAKLAVS